MEGKDYRACRWAAGVAWGLTALYVLYCLLLVASIVWEAAGPEGREPLSVLGLRPYTPYAQEGRFSSVPYFAGSLAESLLLCGAFWQGAALFGGMWDGKTPFARGGWRRVRAAALCVGLTGVVPALADVAVGSFYGSCPTGHALRPDALAAAVLLWALAAAFAYGEALQQQDDETL